MTATPDLDVRNTEDILVLAKLIASETEKVAAYLAHNHLAFPSFDLDGPPASLISTEAVDIEAARLAVIVATQRLRNLILGPKDYLLSFLSNDLLGLHFVARYNLAARVPIHGSATYEDLAQATTTGKADKPAVPVSVARRLLRQAMMKNVFRETPDGTGVVHTAVSRRLVEEPMLSHWMRFNLDENWKAAANELDALERWPHSDEPKRGQRFAHAMSLHARSPLFAVDHLSSSYDWAALGSSTVVDFPQLKIIVQDLEPVIQQATSGGINSSQLSDRVTFMAHDFFEPQTVVADIYLLRWILHNWSDKHCVRILRALTPALKPGARIVINEDVRSSFGSAVPSRWREEKMRSADLTMLQLFNGKERDLQEWQDLLEMADPRFHFRNVSKPAGSALSVMEAVWTG
ncbi:S-adenosyl-L-methionine-dependent methyltransferase [Dissoconium aciculare CBS 342.82]|uniref:S-adenosyl-L-methionine-dependent methyltransferase n=1 Tax=Dissoconium aciculare CBS 342.82 TaxID=1314786 RepID=A0A6J3MEH1_9PEZI|nr:S-adenosyl-L-methionine-dependent methyltransferase [Dissoconium aciculare CBS 342.82]KAF1826400.1 S-adenosyl-L-methionine-dependent methyltransferase [Dissoconium aciculare CBS 342.82]